MPKLSQPEPPDDLAEPTHVCSACGESFPLFRFPRAGKDWRHDDCVKQYLKEWKERNKEKHRKYGRDSYHRNREQNLAASRLRHQQCRQQVLEAYGNRCACCGETDSVFLTVDHVGGGGAEHRRQRRGTNIYRDVQKAKFPYEYRLLCWNCNGVLGIYDYCPHRDRMPPAVVGLDTAGNRWHAVAIHPDGWVRHFGHQAITKGTPWERREQLVRRAQDEFAILPRGSSIWAEEPISSINGRTTITLSMAAGAIETAVFDQDLFWTWVPIQTWKCATVGNGNANKETIKAWVQLTHGRQFRDDDSYDAYCLALYGQQVLGRDAHT